MANCPVINVGGNDYNIIDLDARRSIETLNTELNDIPVGIHPTMTPGQWLNNGVVVVNENEQLSTSDYIEINPLGIYEIICNIGIVDISGLTTIAFYDGSKTYISGVAEKIVKTIPEGTKYIRLCNASNGGVAHNAVTYEIRPLKRIIALEDKTEQLLYSENPITPVMTSGRWLNEGVETVNGNTLLSVSDYISLKPETVSIVCHLGTVELAGLTTIAFYNGSKTYISGVNDTEIFTIPSSAEYIRLCSYSGNGIAHTDVSYEMQTLKRIVDIENNQEYHDILMQSNVSNNEISTQFCTVSSYGNRKYVYRSAGHTFGIAKFNFADSYRFNFYKNGDEGTKFLLIYADASVVKFIALYGATDYGTIYQLNLSSEELSVVQYHYPLISNFDSGDDVFVYYKNGFTTIVNRTKNTVNLAIEGTNACGVVVGGNQGLQFVNLIRCKDIEPGVGDLVKISPEYKVAAFGDSITWYDGHVPDADATTMKTNHVPITGYLSYVKRKFGFGVENEGGSGETIQQICSRIVQYDFTGIDIVTITGGTNDFLQGISAETGKPYLESAIEYLCTNYPNCHIILITPPRGWKDADSQTATAMTSAISDMIKETAEKYGLVCVDWFNKCGINSINYRSKFIDDITYSSVDYFVHPTNAVHAVMGALLNEMIFSIIN